MRISLRSPAAALTLVTLAWPVAAADIASDYLPRQSEPVRQCGTFLGQPITDDMLPAMHAAACCDTLVLMQDSPAVNALERRLHCSAWHHLKSRDGAPPQSFEALVTEDDGDSFGTSAQAPSEEVGPPENPQPAEPPVDIDHVVIPITDLQPSQTVIGWTDLTPSSRPADSTAPVEPDHVIIPATDLQPSQTVIAWTDLTPAQEGLVIPWTRLASPAEFPEGVTPPAGYQPGPLKLPPEQTHAIISATDLQPNQTVVGWTDLTPSKSGASKTPSEPEHVIVPATELQPSQKVVGWTALTAASQKVVVPWTRMTSPSEVPEGVTPPPGYQTGPLNLPPEGN